MNRATCVDCHLPHDTRINYWMVKSESGMRDLWVFTTRSEPQSIHIRQPTYDVIQKNCIRCHSGIVDTLTLVETTGSSSRMGAGKLCWDCHRDAGHGRMSSLTLTPNAIMPAKESRKARWLEELVPPHEVERGAAR
jgi:cytochrome c nitrite reductase small subunit